MTYCDDCLHRKVCGNENVSDEAMTYCCDKLGWIPVSKRLPNLDEYNGPEVWQKKVLITGYLSFDDKKETFVSEVFAEDVIYCFNHVDDTVITAWMPLFEPYKQEVKA